MRDGILMKVTMDASEGVECLKIDIRILNPVI
jgi:hypothetical protein